MSKAAKSAVENLNQARAVELTTPVQAGLRAYHPASLKIMDGIPGVYFQENTVRFEAEDFFEAYDGIVSLIGVARSNYSKILLETVKQQENSTEILKQASNSLIAHWVDVESGRWESEPADEGEKKQRYFGAK